jgi:DnaJ family protein A protein 2
MGGRGGPPQKKKCKPIVQELKVTLEDIYNGAQKKVAVSRRRNCAACDGKGGKSADAVKVCTGCKGKGMRTIMQMLGPGMYSQRTGPCDECNGQGKTIDEKNKCKTCKGKQTAQEQKMMELTVDKGAPHGDKIVLHGEGDEIPGVEAGDFIAQMTIKPHKKFQRKGADLVMEKTISLYEALTGVNFILEHLDGKKIHVTSTPGEVIKPGMIKTIEGYGLPFHKTSYKYGNLYISFTIDFPNKFNETQLKKVENVFSFMHKGMEIDSEKCDDKKILQEYKETQKNSHHEGGTTGKTPFPLPMDYLKTM